MNRNIYAEAADPYFRNRGANAAESERRRRELRLKAAHLAGVSWQHADIDYLLRRRKEGMYRWFALLKWLRRGLLAAGDPQRRALLDDLRVRTGGASVQTHRADMDDCQAAHLMHCSLSFRAFGRECEALDFLTGRAESTRDYKAFASNIFAATANVMSIVNEIDSYLEGHGAKEELADVSERVLKAGVEPDAALDLYVNRYVALLRRARIEYPEVIRAYYAGDSSLEGRIAKGQNLGAAMKKEKKLDLFQVYEETVQRVPGFNPEMINMINRAYRNRHEAWGKAPNRLMPGAGAAAAG